MGEINVCGKEKSYLRTAQGSISLALNLQAEARMAISTIERDGDSRTNTI